MRSDLYTKTGLKLAALVALLLLLVSGHPGIVLAQTPSAQLDAAVVAVKNELQSLNDALAVARDQKVQDDALIANLRARIAELEAGSQPPPPPPTSSTFDKSNPDAWIAELKANTGPRAGVAFQSATGSRSITAPGTYTGIVVNGTLTIGPGVVVQDCKVDGRGGELGVDARNGGTVRFCDVTNARNGIGLGGTALAERNDIWKTENALTNYRGNAMAQENYAHGFSAWTAGAPHYDGVENNGGIDGATYIRNVILVNNGQTSALMLNDWAGRMQNVVARQNVLAGGGYTVYCDHRFTGNTNHASLVFRDNVLYAGSFGHTSFYENEGIQGTPDFDGSNRLLPRMTNMPN